MRLLPFVALLPLVPTQHGGTVEEAAARVLAAHAAKTDLAPLAAGRSPPVGRR